MFNLITLDGFFEGIGNDISWHNVDDEFNEFAHEQLNTADLLLFGRKTYELMAGYWSSPDALESDPITTKMMNQINKIVFSRTLQSADWENTTLLKNAEDEVLKLKQIEGKNIFIFGSSDLAVNLAKKGLVDEYRIIINPLFLGKGKTLLQGIENKINLTHINTRTFKNGNILIYYKS